MIIVENRDDGDRIVRITNDDGPEATETVDAIGAVALASQLADIPIGDLAAVVEGRDPKKIAREVRWNDELAEMIEGLRDAVREHRETEPPTDGNLKLWATVLPANEQQTADA